MSLAWLFPAGLAALATLLLPLLIHLARRDEQQRLDFAALRWLSAKPRPRRRIRFDEWPLLLVRLLLLALLAVLLARPALHGIEDNTPRVAIAPGVDAATALKSAPDRSALPVRNAWGRCTRRTGVICDSLSGPPRYICPEGPKTKNMVSPACPPAAAPGWACYRYQRLP